MRNKAICAAGICAFWIAANVPAAAEGPTIEGAGSTWSKIAIDQWRADVARRGINVNYAGNGSTAGRNFYLIDQVDFAVSEIPFQPEERQQLQGKNKSFQYLPIVAGGTSFMYNLVDDAGKRITDLRLSGPTLAGIFTGAIRNWNDQAITDDNAGRALPAREIIAVTRSDSSGTSAQFSAYLWKMHPEAWADFARRTGIRNEPTSDWPPFPGSHGQQGSDGVANYVANDSVGKGSINYVEYGYAKERGRPVALVQNESGNFSLPTAGNVAVALTHATFNADLTQNLDGVYRAPEPSAYPVSSYSYMITPTADRDLNTAKGAVLGKFMIYFACEGQQDADRLGYSPLPRNLVQGVFDAVRRVPGAPEPPPIEQCGNPTIKQGIPPPSGYTPPSKPPAPITSRAASAAEAAKASGKAAAAQNAARAAQARAASAASAAPAGSKAGDRAGEASPEAIAAAAEAQEALIAAEEAAALAPENIENFAVALKRLDRLPVGVFVAASLLVAGLAFLPFVWLVPQTVGRRVINSFSSIKDRV